MAEFFSSYGLYFTYILIIACVLAVLFFAVARIISNPQGAKNALIGIVALLVLGGIAYGISTGGDANTIFAKLEVSEGTSKMVGAGLMAFYLLIGAAFLSIIYVEVSRLFKKNG